jgi:single-strand DNA-binding protein
MVRRAKEERMNRVLLTGRLTRDPEMRSLANNKTVTQFRLATNEYRGGQEKPEFHTVITWDRLAEICAQFLSKGMLVAIEGRLQTRQWEDDRKQRHWRTEVVAAHVEMLSGRRKKDYATESAAEALATQAAQLGIGSHEASGAGLTAELDDADLEGIEDEEHASDETLTAAAA